MFLTDGPTPKISCLLVTAAGRFDYFRRSVQCYDDQTYPNRELVVVNEGPPAYQRQIADHLKNRPDVRLIFLDGKYTLGALRNISISLCFGELFVQWDDDDFNAPERLAVQYAHLKRHPQARACYLTDQLHYFFTSKRLFWNDWAGFHNGGRKIYSLIPGTVMAYRDGLPARYPTAGHHCSAGEDTVFAARLLERDEEVLLLSGQGHLHVYTYHGGNVWDAEHHMKICRQRALPATRLIENRARITATLNYMRFGGPVRVTGRECLAFIHREDDAAV
jgi:glycosyltransferase involved in cell wall biosynthesis